MILPLPSSTLFPYTTLFRSQAHVAQGQWLAQHKSVHAMMDVSDGIASDLQHILKASKKGAHIDLDQLPLSPQLDRKSTRLNSSHVRISYAVFCLKKKNMLFI